MSGLQSIVFCNNDGQIIGCLQNRQLQEHNKQNVYGHYYVEVTINKHL